MLEGTSSGLAAFGHLFAYRDYRALPPLTGSSPVSDEIRERWRERVHSGSPMSEVEGLALLSDCGVRSVDARETSGVDEAQEAAEEIGWPVAVRRRPPTCSTRPRPMGCGSM